jgi:hypothetical protein
MGQVLGSIAVFITLAYLSVQVRHARQETRRLLSQGRSEAHRDLMTKECDERISRISVKAETALGAPVSRFNSALMERAGLTPEEAWVMASVQSSYWNYYLQFIPSMDELPPTERTQLEGWIRRRYGPPRCSSRLL